MGVEYKDLKPIFEDVAKEMAQYEKLMEGASRQFAKREDFLVRYSGLGGASYWHAKFDEAKPAPSFHTGTVTGRLAASAVEPLDLEKAKPFIRAVIERRLDLLASEENWLKGSEHRTENGVDQYCLIGAQAQALSDLTLSSLKHDPVMEEQRKRVIAAVDRYLRESMQQEHGFTSLPSFNDKSDTTFEDVRLWLKSALGSLD